MWCVHLKSAPKEMYHQFTLPDHCERHMATNGKQLARAVLMDCRCAIGGVVKRRLRGVCILAIQLQPPVEYRIRAMQMLRPFLSPHFHSHKLLYIFACGFEKAIYHRRKCLLIFFRGRESNWRFTKSSWATTSPIAIASQHLKCRIS